MTPLLSLLGAVPSAAPPADLEFGGVMYPIAIPIISLAFMMMIAEQFLNVRAGQKPDWGRPFLRTGGFILLMLLYTPFSQGVIAGVKMFGSIDNTASELTAGTGDGSTKGVLAQRATEFAKLRERLDEEAYSNRANEAKEKGSGNLIPSSEDISIFVEQSLLSIVDTLLYAITWFTFTFAAFAIFALKMLQTAVTRILLEVGPAMIAFAALPGLTSRYLTAWVTALIEVTAWGVVAKIILGLLVRTSAKSAGVAVLEDADYAEHIILNFVYAGLFLAVPTITHMIFSGAASSVGSTGMAAAVGAAAGAGRAAKAAPGAAANAAGDVAGAVSEGRQQVAAGAAAAGQAAGRAGDALTNGPAMREASEAIRNSMTSGAGSSSDSDRAIHAKRGAIDKQRRGD